MGYFGNKLRDLMEAKRYTFASLARHTGLSASGLNHIVTNKVPSPDRQTVEKIIRAFPDSDHIFQLAVAHLDDETPAQARPLIQIISTSGGMIMHEEKLPYGARLDAQFERAVEEIRRCVPKNESLRLAIIDIAGAVAAPPRS